MSSEVTALQNTIDLVKNSAIQAGSYKVKSQQQIKVGREVVLALYLFCPEQIEAIATDFVVAWEDAPSGRKAVFKASHQALNTMVRQATKPKAIRKMLDSGSTLLAILAAAGELSSDVDGLKDKLLSVKEHGISWPKSDEAMVSKLIEVKPQPVTLKGAETKCEAFAEVLANGNDEAKTLARETAIDAVKMSGLVVSEPESIQALVNSECAAQDEIKALKARIAELETQLAEAKKPKSRRKAA